VPGGMLSNFESQLKNMEMIDKLDLLIEEIPKIRKDLGYIPLVTPTSQIVGTQALLNIQNSNRYDSLTNEMIDLVNGKYGKINGKISKDLRDKVKENQSSKQENDLMTVNEYRNIFKQKCLENDLDNIYKNDKHLLNYILFPDITIDYYKELKRADEDQMYDLQEGLGILID
jgi:oxaloacetate decarboxylase alpha subunit